MENNKPETKVKAGMVSASIWKRTRKNQKGEEYDAYQVSLDRAYRDKEGNWKHSASFDVNDIPKAILALKDAYALLVKGQQASSSDTLSITYEDVE